MNNARASMLAAAVMAIGATSSNMPATIEVPACELDESQDGRMRSAGCNKDRGPNAIAKRRRQSKQAKLSRRKNR